MTRHAAAAHANTRAITPNTDSLRITCKYYLDFVVVVVERVWGSHRKYSTRHNICACNTTHNLRHGAPHTSNTVFTRICQIACSCFCDYKKQTIVVAGCVCVFVSIFGVNLCLYFVLIPGFSKTNTIANKKNIISRYLQNDDYTSICLHFLVKTSNEV